MKIEDYDSNSHLKVNPDGSLNADGMGIPPYDEIDYTDPANILFKKSGVLVATLTISGTTIVRS